MNRRDEILKRLIGAREKFRTGEITAMDKEKLFADIKKECDELFGEGEFVKIFDVVYRKKKFNFEPYKTRLMS